MTPLASTYKRLVSSKVVHIILNWIGDCLLAKMWNFLVMLINKLWFCIFICIPEIKRSKVSRRHLQRAEYLYLCWKSNFPLLNQQQALLVTAQSARVLVINLWRHICKLPQPQDFHSLNVELGWIISVNLDFCEFSEFTDFWAGVFPLIKCVFRATNIGAQCRRCREQRLAGSDATSVILLPCLIYMLF